MGERVAKMRNAQFIKSPEKTFSNSVSLKHLIFEAKVKRKFRGCLNIKKQQKLTWSLLRNNSLEIN